MINRRLAVLAVSAAALGGYSLWSDDGTLLRWAGLAGDAPEKVAAVQVKAPPADAPPKSVTALNPLSSLSIAELGEIVARPLFNPARAPAPPAVDSEPPAPEPEVEEAAPAEEDTTNPEDFTLLAVVATDGSRTALVRWNVNNQMFHIKEGESVSDWQLTKVALRDVTLSRNGKTLQLKLFQKLPPGAVPPPAQDQAQDMDAEQDMNAAQDMDPQNAAQMPPDAQ